MLSSFLRALGPRALCATFLLVQSPPPRVVHWQQSLFLYTSPPPRVISDSSLPLTSESLRPWLVPPFIGPLAPGLPTSTVCFKRPIRCAGANVHEHLLCVRQYFLHLLLLHVITRGQASHGTCLCPIRRRSYQCSQKQGRSTPRYRGSPTS